MKKVTFSLNDETIEKISKIQIELSKPKNGLYQRAATKSDVVANAIYLAEKVLCSGCTIHLEEHEK